MFSVPTNRVYQYHGKKARGLAGGEVLLREQGPTLTGGHIPVVLQGGMNLDVEPQALEGGKLVSVSMLPERHRRTHNNREDPAERKPMRLTLIGGSSTLAAGDKQLPVFLLVDGLGQPLMDNGNQMLIYSDSPIKAAMQTYRNWKEGTVIDQPVGTYDVPAELEVYLQGMVAKGVVTDIDIVKYKLAFSKLNKDKMNKKLLVRVARAASTNAVHTYIVGTVPNLTPSKHEILKCIVARSTAQKLSDEELEGGVELPDEVDLIFYEKLYV